LRHLLWVLLLVTGCYSPQPAERGFRCDGTTQFACPPGFTCDQSLGLCVTPSQPDLAMRQVLHNFDLSPGEGQRSCADRVVAGAFGAPSALTSLNTSGDETAIALTSDGKRIYYLAGGALMTAALTAPKTAGAPMVVTVANGPAPLDGFTLADGNLWLSGSRGGKSGLVKALFSDPATAAVDSTPVPEAACAISDPVFLDGSSAKELYVAFPLAGCTDARGSYVAQGLVGKNIGAFVSALTTPGWRAPSLLPGGLTMLVSSTGATPRLSWAQRTSIEAQWSGPYPLDAKALGSTRERQGVVSPDCNTFYFVGQRAGGAGGLDLWAADINP
jgi:hypothetical protein